MRMQKMIVLMVLTSLFLGCGASQKSYEANTALDEMIANKSFKIEVVSAEPMVTQAMAQVANSGLLPPGNSISRIDVAGDGYFIKVQGDSVAADLPYFGERQMGGGYGSHAGIKFDGLLKNLEIVKEESKQRYTVNFSIDSSSENYFVRIAVGNNGSSTTAIRSSHRNRIRYSGDLEALKKD